MNRGAIKIALALFFLILFSILAVQLYYGEEPLYGTIQERREAERYKEMRKDIELQIRESVQESTTRGEP